MSTPVGSSSAGDFTDEVTVSVPAGTQDGDYMVALVTANDGTGITPPVGWTLVREDLFTTTSGVAMWVYERVAASEPADYTWSWDAAHWHFVAMVTWRGYDPIAASDHAEAAGVTEIDLPSLVAQSGDLLLAFGFHWGTATKEWDSDLTEIVNLPRAIIAAYEVQDGGATPSYTLTADTSGTMGATALLLPAPGNTPAPTQQRIWSCGFELQSAADGIEVDGIGGAPEITTDPELVRSGQAALRCTTSGDTAFVQKWVAESEDGPWYVRVYLRIQELPDGDTVVLRGLDDANLSVVSVRLTSTGTLQMWDDHDAGGQVGSDSAALDTDTWYRVELRVGPLGQGAALRVDGTEVAATASLETGENTNRFRFGVCSPATADLVLDDLAVNTDQFPGEGRIIHLAPAGAGAVAEWSAGAGSDASWKRVAETTPDDDGSYSEHATTTQAADQFTVAASGLVTDATVRVLQVGARIGSTGTDGTRDLALTLTADGTTLTGDTVSAAVEGWATHDADAPATYSLTSTYHPGTGEAWTVADLDAVQIGYGTVTSAAVRRRVSTLWLLVEYVDGSAPAPEPSADLLGVAHPLRGMPAIIVEAAFTAVSAVEGVLHLDDPARGLLDEAVLGPDEVFVDISRWSRSVSTARGADRITSPVISYDAGTGTVVLDNRDRRFDPTHLGGPYVIAGRSQVQPMRAMRIRARWGSTTNLVVNPGWETDTAGWEADAATTVERSSAVDAPFGGYSLAVVVDSAAAVEHAVSTTNSGFVGGRVGDGQAVTISLYVRVPAEVYAHVTDVQVAGLSGKSGVDAIPAVSVGVPAPPDTWERLILSTTVAAGTVLHGITVAVHTDGSLAEGDTVAYVDAVQVVAGGDAEPWTPNERVYDLVRGYADSWDIAWSDPNDSTATVTLSDAFKVLNQITLTAVDEPVGAGEDTGARITRVLDAIDWPDGDRDIATGDTTVQATTLDGTALALMQAAAETEIGELYVNGAGKVVFRNRSALFTDARSASPIAVFGDGGTGSGEIGYREVVISADDATLANRVTATREGGTAQIAEDTESIAEFLVRTWSVDNLLMETDEEALAYAQFVLHQSAEPELRFEELRLRPLRDRGRVLPVVLGAEIGDRLRIRRRPPGGGRVIERDVIIRGISHEITPGDWQTTFSLQSATKAAFLVLDDPVLGRLDSNALGY